MADSSPHDSQNSGDGGFPTPRDENGNRIARTTVAQQIGDSAPTAEKSSAVKSSTIVGAGETGGAVNGAAQGATANGDEREKQKSSNNPDDKSAQFENDTEFEEEYLASSRLDINLERDVITAENTIATLNGLLRVCRNDLEDIFEFSEVIEDSIRSLRNPLRTIEPELYARIVNANQTLLRWRARIDGWKRKYTHQAASSASSQSDSWEGQVAAQKLAERQAAEEEKRCRNWEGSMAAALLSQKKLTDQLTQLRTQRDAYQTELAGVRTSLDQLREEGKAFGLAEDEIVGREEVLLNQAIAAERARSAAGRSPVVQQKPIDPVSRQRRAEAAGAKRKSESDFSVSSANSKKLRTQASTRERAEPTANLRRSAANDGARANNSSAAPNFGAQRSASSAQKRAPPTYTVNSRENSPLSDKNKKQTPPETREPFYSKKSKNSDNSRFFFGPESTGFPKTSTPFTTRRPVITQPRKITFEREESPSPERESTPPIESEREEDRREDFRETVHNSVIPRLWETLPSIETGALKPPKYHVGRWDGDVTTYPDHINAFDEFVHSRADILIPQKIQILEGSLPKSIAANFTHYDQNSVGYENRSSGVFPPEQRGPTVCAEELSRNFTQTHGKKISGQTIRNVFKSSGFNPTLVR